MTRVGLMLAAALAAAGCSGGEPPESASVRVGLVFDVGGRGDKSFNDSAYRGLVAARESLGVAFDAIEPDGSDRESALRLLAAGPADLVIGVGFLFTDEMFRLAEEYPEKRFCCIDYAVVDGEPLPPNLRAVRFREEEGAFLAGAIAARTTVGDVVGFVGGMEIPRIRRLQAGYEAGARHAREDVRVLVAYAGVSGDAFENPSKGRELATAQYEAGADVIFHAAASTGLGVFEAARRYRRYVIGVEWDQWDEAPGRVLTSVIKRVDVAILATVADVVAGRFTGGVVELGLEEGGVGYVYDDRNRGLLGDETQRAVEALRDSIVTGRIRVPRS